MFSDTFKSSGNTARETPNPSDLPMDLSPSDPFLIPFLNDLEEVAGARPGRLIPSNPHLFIATEEAGDDDLESKSSNLQMQNKCQEKS